MNKFDYSNEFKVTATANASAAARTETITVTAGNESISIAVTQPHTPKLTFVARESAVEILSSRINFDMAVEDDAGMRSITIRESAEVKKDYEIENYSVDIKQITNNPPRRIPISSPGTYSLSQKMIRKTPGTVLVEVHPVFRLYCRSLSFRIYKEIFRPS